MGWLVVDRQVMLVFIKDNASFAGRVNLHRNLPGFSRSLTQHA